MSLRALVVDDSGVMRKIVIRALKAAGVTDVTEAADGEEALQIYSPGQFDVVLTDWNMPNKNGLEVLQGIRAVDSDVTVIMITTEAEKKRVLQAIEAGVTDYLTKPFEQDALLQKVQKHFPAHA